MTLALHGKSKTRQGWLIAMAVALLVLSATVFGLTEAASTARAEGTVTVKPSNMQGWGIVQETGTTGAIEFVSGPATAPLGTGSAGFTIGNAADGVFLGAALYTGVRLDDLTTLQYSTYVDAASVGTVQAVALQLNFDNDVTDSDMGWKGRLVFEPYQTPSNAVAKGEWQTWDALAGKWWATGAPANSLCPQASPCNLATLFATHPNAGFNSSFGGLLLKAGSGWPDGFGGAADELVIGISGDDTTYDFEPETACTAVCYVDAATGDDSFGGDSAASAKATLQGGLAAVNDGGTIIMAAGTYNEVGQIVINKDVTIEGAGATTVISPTANTGTSGDLRGWFLVKPDAVLDVQDVALDGNGFLIWQALRVTGSGSMTDVSVTDIRYQESGPNYAGTGVAAFGDGPFNITDSTYSEIGRVGVLYFDTGPSGSVYSGNQYTGKGVGDWLDYGVEVGAGAVVTIEDSTFSDNLGVASVDDSTSAGILVTTFFGAGSVATIRGNTITDSTTGIAVGFDLADTSTVTAHLNNITGNGTGVATTVQQVDATCNWWGDASGPGGDGPGTGDGVSGNVVFEPWLTAPAPGGPCNGGLSKNICTEGGWEAEGFKNQGLCIQWVNTGKDSR
jgi:hypothetical protein